MFPFMFEIGTSICILISSLSIAKLPGGTLSLSRDLCGLNGRDDKHLLFNSVVNTQPQEKRAVKHSLL